MKKTWFWVLGILGAIILFFLIIIGMVAGQYNKMVILRENIDGAWAQVDNQLQRRNDLIPNLVRSAKGYMEHEKEIFTYVADAVQANLLAVIPDTPCEVCNVGGGTRISLRESLSLLQELLVQEVPGIAPELRFEETAKGDVRDTFADRKHVAAALGYQPHVPFAAGLAEQVRWVLARREQRA